MTASGLANYKRRPSVTNTKYPTPVVPNIPYNNSVKPVPQKRGPETGNSSSNSSSKSRQNTSGQRESKSGNSEKQKSQNKPKLPELKPTFSTFKQFNRTASLSDLINEDDTSIVVKPEVIQKRTSNQKSIKNSPNSKKSSNTNKNHHHHSNKTIQLDTQSLASVNVNIPDPVLPPTKSITVQTDEALDLNLADFEIPNR